MKQVLLAACAAFIFAGCTDSKKEETTAPAAETVAPATTETKAPLPYPLEKPYRN